MTALDDALNNSSMRVGPHRLTAQWREAPTNEATLNPTDSITDLSRQFQGAMTVSHSLEDALPDPVTVTNGSDASGVLGARLNGSEGLVLASSGQRTYVNTQGTGNWDSAAATTTITVPVANAAFGDSVVISVVVSDNTAALYQPSTDPKDQWQYLGAVEDAPVAMHLFYKRRWHAQMATFTLTSDKSVSFIGQSVIVWGKSPSGAVVDYQMGEAVLLAETASVTNHVVNGKLQSPGYQIGFWGTQSAGAVTSVSGVTLVGNPTANGLGITSGISTFRDAGQYALTGTRSPASALMCMAVVSLQAYERPRMDARKYYSTFNPDSPVYGYDRDTAAVSASARIVGEAGPIDTSVFSGQMQDIVISDRQADLTAVSRTRIRMNRSVSAPVVSGYREGMALDWFVTWLMSRGSQFVGPSPNRYTRYWAPLHGSIHPHYDAPPLSYNAAYTIPATTGTAVGRKNPTWVNGPFSLGMFAQTTVVQTDYLHLRPGPDLREPGSSPFPHITEAGGPFNFDVFSQANSKGRICFYLRADPVASFPGYLAEDYVVRFQFAVTDITGENLGWVSFRISSVDGKASMTMGADASGFGGVDFTASGNLTFDGNWHFYGIWWDFAAGTARVVHNSTESTYSGWTGGGYINTSLLPATDSAGKARGDKALLNWTVRLPIAEIMYDAGMPYPGFSVWADQYPTPTAPGATAVTRRLGQAMNALALSAPINVWDTLADLARNSLSAYRVNEADNYEFLPLGYFGETAQMTAAAVQDTRFNTSDMEPSTDPSNTRNLVTVQFSDTRIDTIATSVLDWGTQMDLSPGTTIITFPLDVPTVEIHGAADWFLNTTNMKVINLTSAQVATPSTIPGNKQFMSVNTAIDGTGTYLADTQVSATIIASDAQSVTIQFVNRQTVTVYMVNNGQDVPFLRILGYGARSSVGYTTASDQKAIAVRGERGLDSEMDWIQDRVTASDIASLLLGVIDRPRIKMTFTVVGDPRRKPGEVVSVLDGQGTQVSGLWRILAVQHNLDGAKYTQDLLTIQQLPIAVWDGPDGWDEGVWGE